jgi:hypothetical protein
MHDYEVEHQFPDIGRRIMLLNARKVFYENTPHTTLLLGIEDVTERRALEREREELLRQKDALLREKDMLLEELQHRVANSLQIIAAIILMKSRTGSFGRDAPASARRSQPSHVGCGPCSSISMLPELPGPSKWRLV